MALYRLDPWGDDWEQTSLVTATIANQWSKKQIKVRDIQPGTLFRRQQSQDEIKFRLDLIMGSMMKRQQAKQGS